MEKILINCPLNINRSFTHMIKEFIKSTYDQDEFQVVHEQHRLDHDSTLLNDYESGNLPVLYIGMALDFAHLSTSEKADNFEPISGFPLGSELTDIGFRDSGEHFQVFAVVPFATIYNKNIVKHPPTKWSDFRNEYYAGKIRFPVRQLPVARVITTNIQDKEFLDNCVFAGSPIEVVNAVDKGEYEFGMVNLSFSRVSRHKNTQILWLAEGLYCMPLVIVVRKGQLAKVKKIINYVYSREIQEFLVQQSFIPALAQLPWPSILLENNNKIIWKGWNNFLSNLKN